MEIILKLTVPVKMDHPGDQVDKDYSAMLVQFDTQGYFLSMVSREPPRMTTGKLLNSAFDHQKWDEQKRMAATIHLACILAIIVIVLTGTTALFYIGRVTILARKMLDNETVTDRWKMHSEPSMSVSVALGNAKKAKVSIFPSALPYPPKQKDTRKALEVYCSMTFEFNSNAFSLVNELELL
uniref:SEA domain-containing protein n=1 Tax=Angiostrongylus cantonensis TaxID=6313 RepID=A0A0K0CXH1_ANGCA